ncbi:predicted protein [Nematostella vectensis]|uniref:Uncharacterized protein n=1 Tax=Nematostella vectensis TaxID=45351 RepID=A7S5W1_NEMVE|nr:predicted protein [Nematostella vectensis]|eukprot:XP_001632895.1 predicted protein [Nematostella vectensis]
MKDPQHLVVDTEHAPSPFVLSGGSVVIQRDEATSRGGPRLHVEVSPNNTEVRLLGFAKALGISSSVGVDVTDQGTGFPIYGRLFDVNDVGLLISSREFLSDMEGTEYSAYGCLQSINQNVTAAVENLVKAAAEEADSFILQANDNLREAKGYYRKASKNEQFFREKLDSESAILEEREREVWSAEERYNNSCQLGHCKKACIGCPDWNRCCTRDVFGNCVECPSWNKCCYTTGDPVCVAKNHGCQHIRKVAEGNLEDAKDILLEQKKHVQLLSRKVFDAEFSKGKTKAVLDAAGKALSLIDRDASTGISASRAIKRHGINGLLNLTSICFTTPVERLATSCIPMNISASLLGSNDVKSLPFSACLNKQLVPNIARFLANTMFPEISRARTRRSLLSEERERYYDDGENIEKTTEHTRKRRDVKVSDEVVERSKERIEPFWDLIHQHNPLDEAAKPIPNHPAMGKATLKRKWKIPVSRRGRCKIYHQLLNICRDMMKTVKRMYGTYMYERYLFAKEKDNFRRRLRRVTKQLEQSAELVSGTKDQIVEIEKSLNFLSNGVRKWMDKSNKEIKRQEMISVKAWVKGMDSRIQSLGGEGVKRFLGNLFKAFDGLFESSNVPSKQAGKALSVMQRVKQIHSAFGEIFKKNITLARANYYADRVLYDVTEIKDIGVYCRK